jgi:hypothetical protein
MYGPKALISSGLYGTFEALPFRAESFSVATEDLSFVQRRFSGRSRPFATAFEIHSALVRKTLCTP